MGYPFDALRMRGQAVTSPSHGTVESLAEQTGGLTTIQGAALSFTPAASTDYLFFWSQDVQSSSNTNDSLSIVKVGGTDIFSVNPQVKTVVTTSPIDYNSMGGIFRVQGDSSPSTQTIEVDASVTGTGSPTLKVRNSRLSYFKLGPNDVYAESLTRQTFATPANKTAQTAATLSFTPGTAGDYLILASFNVDMVSGTNVDVTVTMSDGTTGTGGAWWRPSDANDRIPGQLALYLTGASGAKTITLKIAQPNTGGVQIGISEIRMVALRVDRFAHVYHTIMSSNSSGTNNTYATAFSQTFTPNAADHLTFAIWAQASASASNSVFGQYLDGAVSVNEMIRNFPASASNGLPGFAHRLAAYPNSSLTQAVQRKANTSGTSNVIQSPSSIYTLELTGI